MESKIPGHWLWFSCLNLYREKTFFRANCEVFRWVLLLWMPVATVLVSCDTDPEAEVPQFAEEPDADPAEPPQPTEEPDAEIRLRPDRNERPVENPPAVWQTCNAVLDTCLLPFPSSVFARPDATSKTGYTLEVSETASFGDVWPRLVGNGHDGFSALSPIVTWSRHGWNEGDVDLTWEQTLSSDAAVRLVDVDAISDTYGRSIPFRTEIYASKEEGGGSLLIVTPLVPLKMGGRYAVVITDAVRDAQGRPLEATGSMAQLLAERAPSSASLEPLWQYYDDLVWLAESVLGIARANIVQLWDFPVRSTQSTTSTMRAMAQHNETWARDVATPPQITGESPVMDGETGEIIATRYDFTLELPIWRADRRSPVDRDENGVPVVNRVETHRGILVIADSATPENPAVPLLFGHGLVGDAEGMVTTFAHADMLLDSGPYALFFFDWDSHGTRGSSLSDLGALVTQLNAQGFAGLLLQSAADSIVFSHAATHFGPVGERGEIIAQDRGLGYVGTSMGGLIGLLSASLHDRFSAVVCAAPGVGVANILRGGQIVELLALRPILGDLFAGETAQGLPMDLSVETAILMSQVGFDEGDPGIFARHIYEDRWPESGEAPHILLLESIGDGIMPNFTTETLARTLELPLVAPALVSVPGLEVVQAPTGGNPTAGMTQHRVAVGVAAHQVISSRPPRLQARDFLYSFWDDVPENDGDIRYHCPENNCDLVP